MPATTEKDLKEFFSQYGEVTAIEKPYMRPKAVVTFKSAIAVKMLLTNPPEKLNSKKITITGNKERYFIRVTNLSNETKSEELYNFLTTYCKIIAVDLRTGMAVQPFAIIEVSSLSDVSAALAI